MDVNYERSDNQNNVIDMWHSLRFQPWEGGGWKVTMLSLFQVTEDRDEKREEDRERQNTAFPLLLLRADHCYFLLPSSVLPFLLHFPTPSFSLSPPLTPALLLSPHSKFASTSLSQSLQIMTFGECTLYTKISTSKSSWGLCQLQWIIWEQCSTNRNLSVHVTYYILLCHRTESHHTWHCCILFLGKYSL